MIETRNRSTWRKASALRHYSLLKGCVDAGEQRLFDAIHDQLPASSVLDLGVGAGRTSAQLIPLCRSYVGVDYEPKMVELARLHCPGGSFQIADARDLSSFGRGQFDLAIFSFNGLDSVDFEGREKIFSEVHRVLRPGGRFLFSTINLEGPTFRRAIPLCRRLERGAGSLGWAKGVVKYLGGNAIGLLRYVLNRNRQIRTDGRALLLHPAHDFGIMVHATSYDYLLRQLKQHGFVVDGHVWGRSGQDIDPARLEAEEFFYVMTHKSL